MKILNKELSRKFKRFMIHNTNLKILNFQSQNES